LPRPGAIRLFDRASADDDEPLLSRHQRSLARRQRNRGITTVSFGATSSLEFAEDLGAVVIGLAKAGRVSEV
jgi:hypothetical protein